MYVPDPVIDLNLMAFQGLDYLLFEKVNHLFQDRIIPVIGSETWSQPSSEFDSYTT